MALLYYISYIAVLFAFAFVTLSLASGLLYISELIEEHSRLAKVIGQRVLYAVIVLYLLLYVFDSLPLPQTAFSIFCHFVYLQNFSSSWPLISLTSLSFLASCVLVLADHFIWFFYFARITHEARYLRSYHSPAPNVPGFTEIASFFAICVWLVPLFLFLSLSANDNALPISAAEPGSPTSSSVSQRVSLVRSIFSLFSFDILPRVRPRVRRKDTSEGLIAPRSPKPPQSPLHPPSSPMLGSSSNYGAPQTPTLGGVSRFSAITSPPRSPGPSSLRIHEFEQNLSSGANFKLGTPPVRRVPSAASPQNK